MPPRKSKAAEASPSPDPLAGSDTSSIRHIPTPRKGASASGKSTPRSGAKGKARKAEARDDDEEEEEVEQIETPSKKRRKLDTSPTPSKGKGKSTPLTGAKKPRTPLGKASPASNIRASVSSSSKKPPTLASSTGKVLPTPTRAKPTKTGSTPKATRTPVKPAAVKETVDDAMPNFDEAFAPSSSRSAADKLGSRETFLTNEAMKRAREARNFLYEGDKDAPTLTRSGRVVAGKGKGKGREREVDEYGDVIDPEADTEEEAAPSDDGTGGIEVDEDVEGEVEDDAHRGLDGTPGALEGPGQEVDMDVDGEDHGKPLPTFVRTHFVDILNTLSGRHIALDPPPFEEEGTNEALQQLLGVLQGTVERGEGNSALVVGPRGTGKTRTVARALSLLNTPPKSAPIIVRLSGHAQTNDRLAIREMGRQIAEAEGGRPILGEGDEEGAEEEGEEYAPTTLPSHLLALLTAPSPRAIVIVMEEFDLFTEHARQALLYCLLDVVQSVKTGPVESTGRGVAVIGLTTRTDTLLLLEKRVKSRFSHRIFRVISPLAPLPTKDDEGEQGPEVPWRKVLTRALVPWSLPAAAAEVSPAGMKNGKARENGRKMDAEEEMWRGDWEFAIETLLKDPRVVRYMSRLSGLLSDVRNIYRPFIPTIAAMLTSNSEFILARQLSERVIEQIDGAGWGLQNRKIRGLPHPAMGVLIISKHLHYAGREEFNFAQVEEEYLRFARTKLVGSGKTRWAIGVLRNAYYHLLRLGILVPTHSGSVRPQFQRVRCTITPHEVVAWFKGEGANLLGPELGNWGRMMGGHA